MIKSKSKKEPSLAQGRTGRGKGKLSSPTLKNGMGEKSPSANSFPEIPFIICKRRKNQPKISPLVCEQRCQWIKGCPEYFDYIQPSMFGPAAFHRREHMRRSRNQNKSLAEPAEKHRETQRKTWFLNIIINFFLRALCGLGERNSFFLINKI